MINTDDKINDLDTNFWCSREIEAIPLILAERIRLSAMNSGLLPSEVFCHAKISTLKVSDDWNKFRFSEKHYLDFSKINKIKITSGEQAKIEDSLKIFSDSKAYLPLIETDDISDWPYLFAAQLQVLSEQIFMTPLEALMVFGIIYDGYIDNYWEEFSWKFLITRKFTNVGLICGTKSFPKMN